jgi:hypothetical protein
MDCINGSSNRHIAHDDSLFICRGKGKEQLEKVVLDYAYYSPTSIALKEFGWAGEAFEEQGIKWNGYSATERLKMIIRNYKTAYTNKD